jgi:hypothetical protein
MKNKLLRTCGFKKATYGIFFILFLGLLACLAYKGIFSRYLQDDYCYGNTIHSYGFFKGIVYPYFHTTEYNGNRYSLTLFAGLAEILLGTKLQSLFALISILAWVGSLSFLIYEIFKGYERKYLVSLSFFIASILVTFTCYLAPDLYQSLYWRNSSLTYLAPIIVNLFVVDFVFHQSKKTTINWPIYLVTFFAGFLAAGFSEVGTVWQVTLWGFTLVFYNFFLKDHSKIVIKNKLVFTVMAGVLLGAVLLIISPVNSSQLMGSSVNIASFPVLIKKSFRFGFDFLNYSLTGKWLPFFVLFMFGYFLAQFFPSAIYSIKNLGKNLLITVLCTYLISVACMMPSVLVRTAYPDPRALLIPHFTLTISIFLIGILTGRLVSFDRLFHPNTISNFLICLLLLGLVLYSIRMIPLIVADVSPLQARAVAWDQRQAYIYQEKASGVMNITVPAFDSIAGINELHLEENHWVNKCAASYYGVNSISAVENFNGVKPYFK